MSSEAITKNDLSSILDGIGMKAYNTGDMRKLLWTNSSSASFAAQTIPLDLSDYDCVEVWFKEDDTLNSQLGSPIRISVGKENSIVVIHSLAYAGVNENIGSRHISVSTTGVSFGNYQYKNRRSGGSLTTDNSFCIPLRIYGIKLGTGYRQNELLITDPELETLASSLGLSDDRLYDVLNALVGRFRGCDKDRVESLGAVSSVTPTRDGWLSVQAQTNSGATIPAALDIKLDGAPVERSYGLAIAGESMYTGIPVKKGQTYTITVYRASITNVKLYY